MLNLSICAYGYKTKSMLFSMACFSGKLKTTLVGELQGKKKNAVPEGAMKAQVKYLNSRFFF